MGRAKRQFPIGTFFHRVENMPDANKQYPIYIRYIWDRKVVKKDTGFSAKIKDWNQVEKEQAPIITNIHQEDNYEY